MNFKRFALSKTCLLVLFLSNVLHAQNTVSAPATTVLSARQTPPVIIIKADDVKYSTYYSNVVPSWNKFINVCLARKIPASLGVICNSLEIPNNDKYIGWIKTQQARVLNGTKQFEFWNHGYDHKDWDQKLPDNTTVHWYEFKGPSYDYQKDHYTWAQNLARTKLGAPFTTFGAPNNQTGSSIIRILQEDPACKVWLYGDPQNTGGKKVLKRIPAVNLESDTAVVNYNAFVKGYNENLSSPYFVVQGHPGSWTQSDFDQFDLILNFLESEDAIFMTPIEYSKIAP